MDKLIPVQKSITLISLSCSAWMGKNNCYKSAIDLLFARPGLGRQIPGKQKAVAKDVLSKTS